MLSVRTKGGRMLQFMLVAMSLLQLSWIMVSGAFPPTSITPPYRQTKSVHFMNVDAGTSALTGSLAIQPGTFGTHFPTTSFVGGLPTFSGELAIPNSLDDPLACRDPTLRLTDDTNSTFAGKVLLIHRGWCTWGQKGKRAELAGAAAAIVYGCPTTAPTLCIPGLQRPFVAVIEVGIPVFYIQTADGEALVAYIKARNAAIVAGNQSIPSPAIMQVMTTGPLVSSELTALKAIAATTIMSQDTATSNYGILRPWNPATFNNASTDPCLNRVAGIWCENGHIVDLYIAGMKWTSLLSDGSIPPEFGSFLNLRSLAVPSNMFKGAVPQTICQLTKLQELYLQLQVSGNYDGITSIPSCLSQLTELNTIQINNNQIDAFPSFDASSKLAFIDISNNHIHDLPTSFTSWTSLNTLSASNNKFTVLPSLSSFLRLTSFKMSDNSLTSVITPTTFDNLSTLVTLDLSNNYLSGVLPDMRRCPSLQSLLLSGNMLSSSIPLTWPTEIPNLLLLKASHNQIFCPVVLLFSMLQLQLIDLSWNNLTAYTGDPLQTGDAGAMIDGMTGPSVITLNLAHNRINGRFDNNWLQLAKALRTLDISYNGITTLPTDLFEVTVTSLEARNNQIVEWGATTATPSPDFIYLSLINNPGLIAASLPSWMKEDVQMVTYPESVFQCPRMINPNNAFMTIQVDAQFTQYRGCRCIPGRFGVPPLCYSVPQTSTLQQDGLFASSEIGTNFATVVGAMSGRTEPNSSDSASAAAAAAAVPSDMVDRSFSDAWYGNQRLTLGISTAFIVDLRSSAQTVRFLLLHMHIDREIFNDSNDLLTVYEGPSILTSPRVSAAQGDLPIPPNSDYTDGYTTSASYQTMYSSRIAAMSSSVSLWEIVVLGPVATVSFNSRDTEGQHFLITYSYSYECSDLGTGYFFDETQMKCRAPLEMYTVNSSIRIAGFTMSTFTFLFVLIVTVIVVIHFDSPVIRASSRAFLLLILLFLGMMSLGSLLYMVEPDESSLGKAVCNGRVWLAAFPLTGILATLLVKTNRISSIFTTMTFTIRPIKDQELGIVVCGLMAVVTCMLAIYSGVPLNSPRVAEGTSTYANKLVSSCHNTPGFTPWIGILLFYIFVLMIVTAALAFKARNVPSRFNESTHIMNALFLLIFFSALIVPLDILIQDSPDASMLIQGVGQSLLVSILTGVIFLPKLYVLFSNDLSVNTNTAISSLTVTKTNPVRVSLQNGTTNNPVAAAGRGSLSKQVDIPATTSGGTGRGHSRKPSRDLSANGRKGSVTSIANSTNIMANGTSTSAAQPQIHPPSQRAVPSEENSNFNLQPPLPDMTKESVYLDSAVHQMEISHVQAHATAESGND